MSTHDESPEIVYTIDGQAYPLRSFKLGELEWLENELGASVLDMNPFAMGTLVGITAMVRRRTDPDFTMDDARKLDLDVLHVKDDPDADPPKVASVKDAAAKRAARKPKPAGRKAKAA